MSSKPRGIDSPTDPGFVTLVSNGPSNGGEGMGGRPGFPMQTPSKALGTKIVEGHLNEGDAPSDPRAGSRGKVSTPFSDAPLKTR